MMGAATQWTRPDRTRRERRWPSCTWKRSLLAAWLVGALAAGSLSAADVAWQTGAAFDRALQQPVSIFREESEVLDVLQRIATAQHVACLLDRRVDPSQPVALAVTQRPLQQVLDDIAAQIGCVTGRLGSTVLLGRPAALDRLLTEAAAQQEQLRRLATIPSSRRLQLVKPRELVWSDLDRPVDLLAQISRGWQIEMLQLDRVPHDLWRGGTAVGVDAVEALTLVLGQFELSFEWREAGRAIEIVPAAPTPVVTRLHRPRGITPAVATSRLEQTFPGLTVTRRGSGWEIAATVLQHAAIEKLLGESTATAAPPATGSVPLDRRRFANVRILRKPLGAVLKALQQQGLEIVYDEAALQAAGIDLERLVTIEFQDAGVDDLFAALCSPAGLKYELDGDRIRLHAAKTATP